MEWKRRGKSLDYKEIISSVLRAQAVLAKHEPDAGNTTGTKMATNCFRAMVVLRETIYDGEIPPSCKTFKLESLYLMTKGRIPADSQDPLAASIPRLTSRSFDLDTDASIPLIQALIDLTRYTRMRHWMADRTRSFSVHIIRILGHCVHYDLGAYTELLDAWLNDSKQGTRVSSAPSGAWPEPAKPASQRFRSKSVSDPDASAYDRLLFGVHLSWAFEHEQQLSVSQPTVTESETSKDHMNTAGQFRNS